MTKATLSIETIVRLTVQVELVSSNAFGEVEGTDISRAGPTIRPLRQSPWASFSRKA